MQDSTQSTTRRTQRTKQPAGKSTARDQGDSRPRRPGGRGTPRSDGSPPATALQELAQGESATARPVAARRQVGRAIGTGRSGNNGLGRYGEQVAARRLVADGLRILERNWRCAEGELDIVALDGETLAVCEVKTRSERSFQQPSEAIDATKANRLRRLAERWLAERWPVHFAALAEGVSGSLAGPPFATSSGARGVRSSASRHGASVTGAPDGSGDGPPGTGTAQPATADPFWPAPPPPGGVRIDLVAVINRIKGAATVEHLRGVV